MSVRTKSRNRKGAVLAEASASTALFYGVLLLISYALIQASLAIYIMYGLNQASREAAREAAIIYMKSAGGQTPTASVLDSEFQKILVPGVVNGSNQFTSVWPTTYSKNAHPLPTVTVTVVAAPGQSGTNGYPSNIVFPGARLVGGIGNVFSLNGLTMKASCTYPLRP